jgi:Reverse transcriptase (RNA-dependent DNA polymerase)
MNLKSAFDAPFVVSSAIQKPLENSHALGPFESPPLTDFRSSPLGTVTCKHNPKRRLINHLSWPRGNSVNDGIPDSEGHIKYETFDRAVQLVCTFRCGALLVKLDLKEAFHHIPIAPSQWHLLGFHWESKSYYPIVLIFGLKSAPYIFNLFAEALHWIIHRHLPSDLCHYLDDFLPVFQPQTLVSTANAAIDWCIGLGTQLGLCFQDEKTIRPCTNFKYLGLELDSLAMEARLPTDKLAYLCELLDALLPPVPSHCGSWLASYTLPVKLSLILELSFVGSRASISIPANAPCVALSPACRTKESINIICYFLDPLYSLFINVPTLLISCVAVPTLRRRGTRGCSRTLEPSGYVICAPVPRVANSTAPACICRHR